MAREIGKRRGRLPSRAALPLEAEMQHSIGDRAAGTASASIASLNIDRSDIEEVKMILRAALIKILLDRSNAGILKSIGRVDPALFTPECSLARALPAPRLLLIPFVALDSTRVN